MLTKKYGMASIRNCNFSGHQDLPNTPVLLILTLELKTHLSITIRLLRQLSKPNRYVSFFWDTLYKYTIVNCSLLVFGVVVIVKKHNGRLGLVDDRVLLQRKCDTLLLPWPRVKVENNIILVFFTPLHSLHLVVDIIDEALNLRELGLPT